MAEWWPRAERVLIHIASESEVRLRKIFEDAARKGPSIIFFRRESAAGGAPLAITLGIYSHWFEVQDSGAIDRLSGLVPGS